MSCNNNELEFKLIQFASIFHRSEQTKSTKEIKIETPLEKGVV